MRFRILGPLEVHGSGDVPVPLRASKQRTLLAVLLLHANQRVSGYRLEAAVWPDQLPRTATSILRTYVSALRRLLSLDDPDRLPWLAAQSGGYKLAVAPADLDLSVFEDLAGRGRSALEDGDTARAARLLRDALGLWRGNPAEDIMLDGDTEIALAGLLERRLATEEAWIDSQLALGTDPELIARLRSLVAEQPLRERLCGQLMLALYRAGRQAEALDAFQALRRRMVDELGIEPGSPVQRLQRQILAGDTTLSSPPRRESAVLAPPVVPRQLPPDIADFTGRRAHLERLHEVLEGTGEGRPAAMVISAIDGTAGVGKTALAIHWAHQVADRFIDGQLHVNLRGYGAAQALDPLDALQRFLRALGTAPEQVPSDVDEAAAMYRSQLAGRGMLILLDNAASASQVRPLLPGSPGCLALVTSRSRLPGLVSLDGARRITIDPLAEPEAVHLLRKILGHHRVDAEPIAAAEIAAYCAFLPLALRIAAERAARRPLLSLARLSGELAVEQERLDVLAADDEAATVRAVFSWSYHDLAPDAARMFRLLGLHAGRDIGVPAAAALAAASEAEASRLLDTLSGLHLVGEAAPGRYRFHDLLRAYAAERARTDETQEDRVSAARRLFTWYLHTADAADRVLAPARRHVPLGPPQHCEPLAFAGYAQALAWCDAEHPNLVAVIGGAAETGDDDIAWKLLFALWGFFELRKAWADWIASGRIGADAARRAGDSYGESCVLNSLSVPYRSLGRFDDSLGCLKRALRIREETGDRQGEGATLNNIGGLYGDIGRFADAVGCFKQALAIARDTGYRLGEGIATENLGEAYIKLRRPGEALTCFQRALAIARETGYRQIEGIALNNLAGTYRMLRQPGAARDSFEQALEIRRQASDRHGEAETLRDLGDLLHEGGSPGAAGQAWHQALAVFDDLGHPQADQIRDRLENLSPGNQPAGTV